MKHIGRFAIRSIEFNSSLDSQLVRDQRSSYSYLRCMFLQKLSLVNFKNYEEAEWIFSPGVNAFVGGNGEGKTNILDAVHYLSLCKSYFNPIDSQNVKHGSEFFLVQGTFNLDGKEENIYCGLKKNQRKIIKRNQKEYDRFADHIGLLPVVMVSPTDT